MIPQLLSPHAQDSPPRPPNTAKEVDTGAALVYSLDGCPMPMQKVWVEEKSLTPAMGETRDRKSLFTLVWCWQMPWEPIPGNLSSPKLCACFGSNGISNYVINVPLYSGRPQGSVLPPHPIPKATLKFIIRNDPSYSSQTVRRSLRSRLPVSHLWTLNFICFSYAELHY